MELFPLISPTNLSLIVIDVVFGGSSTKFPSLVFIAYYFITTQAKLEPFALSFFSWTLESVSSNFDVGLFF